jgi:hypothetical protein
MSDDPRSVLAALFDVELARTDTLVAMKIELVYAPPADYGREVLRTWRREDPRDAYAFDTDAATGKRAKLISTIMELAEQRATVGGAGGRQMFRVVIHQASGDRVPAVFAILPSFDGSGAELAKEYPAAAAGVLQQTMDMNGNLHLAIGRQLQHFERLFAGVAGMIGSLTKHQAERDERLWARVEFLEDRNARNIDAVESAKSQEHQRLLETKVEEAKIADRREVITTVKEIGGAIMNHMRSPKSDDKGKGTNGTPNLAVILREFFDTLSKEQLSELQGAMSLEQMMALKEINDITKSGDASRLPELMMFFYSKLNEATVDAIADILTGKQRKAFDEIHNMVQDITEKSRGGESKQGDAASAS